LITCDCERKNYQKRLNSTLFYQVFSGSEEWMDVAMNVSESDWKEGSIVALTPFFNSTIWEMTQVPQVLRDILKGSSTSSSWNITLEEAGQLAQWSDIILFDYITGVNQPGQYLRFREV
jgi:hypothetical protein